MPRVDHDGDPGPDLLHSYELDRLKKGALRKGLWLGSSLLVLSSCMLEIRFFATTHLINALAIVVLCLLVAGFLFADGAIWFWIAWMHAAKEIKRGETKIQAGSILFGALGSILVAVPFGSMLLMADDLRYGGFPIRCVAGFTIFAWTHLLGGASGYAARYLTEFRRLW